MENTLKDKPNPKDYDVIHLGVSGGKDSTAVMLWLVYESNWPKDKIQITFCDTGNEDPLTYNYLKLLNDTVFPINTLKPEKDFWELAKWKKRFPSRKARFCTQFLKIIPTREHTLELLQENKNVLLLNGVRSAEGKSHNNRGDVPMFGFDLALGADVFRPILNWTIDDVWAIHMKYIDPQDVKAIVADDPDMDEDMKDRLIGIMEHYGIPRNPIYDMGNSRVGCFPCINSRKLEIRAISNYRPNKIDFIEDQENSFPNEISTFFAKKTVPPRLRSKPIETKSGEIVNVPTIRDVVKWANTGKYKPDQMEMDLDILAPASACDIGGYCE